MEKSYIKSMDINYLNKFNIKNEQIDKIENLVNYAIKEQLYTNTKVMYHDLKHIEKVLIYISILLNKVKYELENIELLYYACLFHDSGRSQGASDKTHGVVGAKIAKDKLKDNFNEKDLNTICMLIETHAVKEDKIKFKNYKYTKKEKKNIQLLSNILKDSDALDRNRFKLFPFWKCNPKFLRTKEAKELFNESNNLYKEYYKAMKKSN